jgi:biotin carboxylase
VLAGSRLWHAYNHTGERGIWYQWYRIRIVSFKTSGDTERAHELVSLVEGKNIDLVVPVSDQDAVIVARAKQLFPENEAFFSSPVESVLITRSRNRTTDLCRSTGIDTPATVFVTHKTAADAAGDIGFPCFLKLSGSVASQGVFEIPDQAGLKSKLALVPKGAEMQLQAKVEGDLADITGFACEGLVIQSFAFKCDYEHSHGGTPPYSSRVHDGRLEVLLSKIVKALNWTGGIDLDLIQKKDGDYVLLEINPRFSGTTVFPLKLGIDLPMGYVNLKRNIDVPSQNFAAKTDAENFISLLEESLYLRVAGEAGRQKAMQFRSDEKWVDNSFWDDWKYSAALFEYIRMSLLYRRGKA